MCVCVGGGDKVSDTNSALNPANEKEKKERKEEEEKRLKSISKSLAALG